MCSRTRLDDCAQLAKAALEDRKRNAITRPLLSTFSLPLTLGTSAGHPGGKHSLGSRFLSRRTRLLSTGARTFLFRHVLCLFLSR